MRAVGRGLAAALALLALGWAPPARASDPELRLAGGDLVLSPYVLFQLDGGTTFGHSGPGGPGAGVNVRRFRLGAEMAIAERWTAALVGDFAGVPGGYRPRLYEASLGYDPGGLFSLKAGLFTHRYGLTEAQSEANRLFLERPAAVAAATGVAGGSERFGLRLQLDDDERWMVALGLIGGGVGPGQDSTRRGAALRAAGLAVKTEDISLHLGANASLADQPGRLDGERALSLAERPELALTDWDSPFATGTIPSGRARSGGLEAGLARGRLWSQAEAYRIEVDRRSDPGGGTLAFGGWYLQAAYLLIGEPRQWSASGATWGAPRPGGDGFEPRAGRWGAVEVGARYSELDLSDRDVRGGRQRIWTAGASWWPVEPVRVTLQYQHATLRGSEADRRFQAVALRGQVYF